METQEFWLEKEYLTDRLSIHRNSSKCIKIRVPLNCPVCGKKITTIGRSDKSRTILDNWCNHFHYGPGDANSTTIMLWKHCAHLNPWLNVCPQCGKEHQ